MNGVRVASLLIHTAGLLAYGAIAYLSWRELLQPAWARTRRPAGRSCRPVTRVGCVFMLSLFAWYALNLGQVLMRLYPGLNRDVLQIVSLVLTFLFPAMIMHTSYQELWTESRPSGPRWRLPIGAAYVLGVGFAAFSALGFGGLLGLPGSTVSRIVTPALGVLFLATGIYSRRLMGRVRRGRQETPADRVSRRMHGALYAALALLFVPMILALVGRFSFIELFTSLVVPLIPMSFLFVGTYFEDRFEFFDLFLKRGVFLLATVALFTAAFALLLPVLDALPLGWTRPWVFAIVMLPLGLLLPWLSRRLGGFVDNAWLGRRFDTVEAVKHFLATTQSATSQEELARRAEEALEAIFHAAARIDLSLPAPATGEDGSLQVPIHAPDGERGVIRLGSRRDRMPFFRQDVELVSSLGQVLAYLLENVRLQHRKQEEEQRARELSLHASRSELKALRAQVNPHFLFNALNAIAGLIHQDPARADRTVEELAEVFRYTLRRSESEWARLEDELEFVRAYLEVEGARFGARFRFSLELDESARSLVIPALMIQTLVENAVKHGVAAVRGPARIEVHGRRRGEALEIEVSDNGPGFPAGRGRTGAPRPGGYGLANVGRRLRGYYGAEAALSWDRDESEGRTRVRIRVPAAHRAPGPRSEPATGRRVG